MDDATSDAPEGWRKMPMPPDGYEIGILNNNLIAIKPGAKPLAFSPSLPNAIGPDGRPTPSNKGMWFEISIS